MDELETSGDFEEEDNAENTEENASSTEKEPRSGASGKKRTARFWISLAILFILTTVALGLGLKMGLNLLDRQEDRLIPEAQAEKKVNHTLFEESISPFFIPLPEGSPKVVLKIDLSIIWDGITSVRFKRKKLQVRDRVYRHMVDLATKHEDLDENSTLLETEIGDIVRKSLGIGDLEVRITKVLYL